MTDKLKELKINPNTVVGTSYSQLVGVTVTDIDVTLEFVYINPRDNAEGVVVARVTLPTTVATALSEKINSTIQTHDKNKDNTKKD